MEALTHPAHTMGILSRASEAYAKKRRLEQAAEQLWVHISAGKNLEVPLHLNKDDDYIQAIKVLQKKHPEVQLRMYQSKGLVLGLHQPGVSMKGVSPDAMASMRNGGYFGQSGDLPIETLLAQHEAWLVARGFDPAEQERLAQEGEATRHRIEIGGLGTAPEAEPLIADKAAPPKDVRLFDADGNLRMPYGKSETQPAGGIVETVQKVTEQPHPKDVSDGSQVVTRESKS